VQEKTKKGRTAVLPFLLVKDLLILRRMRYRRVVFFTSGKPRKCKNRRKNKGKFLLHTKPLFFNLSKL
jgi:hypothetical protein